MTNVLAVESSPRGEQSASRQLTKDLIAVLKLKHPDLNVVTRDLVKNPPPHVSGPVIGAVYTPEEARTPSQVADLKLSDEYLAEFFKATIIILGAPMWNFNIPSSLKAWIDHIVRVGKTFAYLPNGGYKGLVEGKKLYILSASGGAYGEGAMKTYNFNEPYLRAVFGFIGVTDVQFFTAEGVHSPETQVKAVAKANQQIQSTVK